MKRLVLALSLFSRVAFAEPTELERAESAFYAGRFQEALQIADRLETTQSRESEISPERPRLLLLRGAIFARLGDEKAAKASLKRAFILDPDLDASPFPPPIPALVESVRLELPARVMVRLKNVPADVRVRIDGRDASPGFLPVFAGDHQLVVAGRARKTVIRTIQVRNETTLDVDSIAARSRFELAGYGCLGIAAISAAGVGANGYGYGATQRHRANAEGAAAQRFYDKHLDRYTLGTGVSALALTASGIGAYLLLREPKPSKRPAITFAPAGHGGVLLIHGEF